MLKVIKLYANKDVTGIYGDIYTSREECVAEHPNAEVLEGFGVLDTATNYAPDDSRDWYDTEAEAQAYISGKSKNGYRRSELDKVDATGEYPAKIKFYSDAGDTKTLNITATEFEQIKAVLLDYRNDL